MTTLDWDGFTYTMTIVKPTRPMGTGFGTRVFMDGLEVGHVVSLEIKVTIDEPPHCKLETIDATKK